MRLVPRRIPMYKLEDVVCFIKQCINSLGSIGNIPMLLAEDDWLIFTEPLKPCLLPTKWIK